MSRPCVDPAAVAQAILRLCTARGPAKSICPSEVARALAGSDETVWRFLMPTVRREAFRLAEAGAIEVLRKGKPATQAEARGVIRLRIRHSPQTT